MVNGLQLNKLFKIQLRGMGILWWLPHQRGRGRMSCCQG